MSTSASANTTPLRLYPDRPTPRLYDAVVAQLRTRHDSLKTEKAYIHWIQRFLLFHKKRHPLEMGKAEVSDFLTHLAVDGNVAASTQNQGWRPSCSCMRKF